MKNNEQGCPNSFSKREVWQVVLSLMLPVLVACEPDWDVEYNRYNGEEPPLEDTDVQYPSLDGMTTRGYYENTKLWPQNEYNISVCFTQAFYVDGVAVTSNATAMDRAHIKQLVEDSWDRVSAIDFTGWGVCPPGVTADINVWAWSGWPIGSTYDFGVINKGHHANVPVPTNGIWGAWETNTVLHEFGHVLGFRHEHGRPDSLCDEHGAESGYTTYGNYDPNSVMHYLCKNVSWYATTLSDTDIDTVLHMYGTYINGTFKGWGGYEFRIRSNSGQYIPMSQDGEYELTDVLYYDGDAFELTTDPSQPTRKCNFDSAPGLIGHDNVGQVDISCYDVTELTTLIAWSFHLRPPERPTEAARPGGGNSEKLRLLA